MPIGILTAQPFSHTFTAEDVTAIDEIVATGHYGASRDAVIDKALSLLYTISVQKPGTKFVIVQDNSGKATIPL
jgi:hypothetical protein